MNELDEKPCGWTHEHGPHHIAQESTDSFNCPGYSVQVENVLSLVGRLPAWKPEVKW